MKCASSVNTNNKEMHQIIDEQIATANDLKSIHEGLLMLFFKNKPLSEVAELLFQKKKSINSSQRLLFSK